MEANVVNVAMVVEAFIGGLVIGAVLMYWFRGKLVREVKRAKEDLQEIINVVKDTADKGSSVTVKDALKAARAIEKTLH